MEIFNTAQAYFVHQEMKDFLAECHFITVVKGIVWKQLKCYNTV